MNGDQDYLNILRQLKKLIPMNRMANKDEYKGATQFMISEASYYINESTLVIDGGRTIW